MFDSVSKTYENLFDIKGRITRKQFWSTALFNLAILFVLLLVSEVLFGIAYFLVVIINFITAIKRAHDVGYAGWYILIPLFNLIILISNSEAKENKWGPSTVSQ